MSISRRPKSPKQTLLEVADSAYWFGAMRGVVGSIDKPGAYYDRLPQETKDILKNLKSDDISSQALSVMLRCGQPEGLTYRLPQEYRTRLYRG